jgi:hypothetical protein
LGHGGGRNRLGMEVTVCMYWQLLHRSEDACAHVRACLALAMGSGAHAQGRCPSQAMRSMSAGVRRR